MYVGLPPRAEGGLMSSEGRAIDRAVQCVSWDPVQAQKSGYKHFMLKEIHEQARATRDTCMGRINFATGRVVLDECRLDNRDFAQFRDIKIVACGTSWHAALVGKFLIERLARIPVD